MQKFRAYPLILWLFLLPLLAQPALGADATSFDPTRVEVKAKGSGVPVGMILAWPVGQNPEDMDNWLECNGQSISRSVYPELSALVGGNVPDLRGLFLRGHGGNSAALGVRQGDATRAIRGEIGSGHPFAGADKATGAFRRDGGSISTNWNVTWGAPAFIRTFDSSRVVPTAEENRPVNQAVRYLIRARP